MCLFLCVFLCLFVCVLVCLAFVYACAVWCGFGWLCVFGCLVVCGSACAVLFFDNPIRVTKNGDKFWCPFGGRNHTAADAAHSVTATFIMRAHTMLSIMSILKSVVEQSRTSLSRVRLCVPWDRFVGAGLAACHGISYPSARPARGGRQHSFYLKKTTAT